MRDKHVIILVIDALCHEMMDRKVGQQLVMPFLNGSRRSGTSWDSVYSLAPYTEASLVSLLGREKTLTGGGYLFGNAVCANTLPEVFKRAGYVTSGTFSPYVYSKAYLKGFDLPFHTRLFDINPLFNYRIRQLADLYTRHDGEEASLQSAAILLKEAIETWLGQVNLLIDNDESVGLLVPFLSDEVDLDAIHCELSQERDSLLRDPLRYARSCFESLDNNKLRLLNAIYRTRPEDSAELEVLKEAYKRRVTSMQARYIKMTRKNQGPDLKYLASTLLLDQTGWSRFKGVVHNYMRLHSNRYLSSYFEMLNAEPKYEVSLRRQMARALKQIRDLNADGKKTFTYIHAQDFHLPSVFHCTDDTSCETIENDLRLACELLNKMDGSYRGNILADLSAAYVDRMICDFKSKLDVAVPGDYTLVVTADHGYPSLFDPPRPRIYNQTYTEAFHVPFCVFGNPCDGYELPRRSQIVDNLSLFNLLWEAMGVLDEDCCKDELPGYVLTEHGGPGCPNLSNQEIWYTYIDNMYRVSARCMLGDDLDYSHVTDVFDLRRDGSETKNLYRLKKARGNVAHCVSRIAERHGELSRSIARDGFFTGFYSNACIAEDFEALFKGAQHE